MEHKVALGLFILIICMFSMTSCGDDVKPYTSINGQIITKLDTRSNKVQIKGIVPSSLVLVKYYECRIEDNSMYIKVMLIFHKYGKYKEIDFEQELPDSIEKIFIEDNKNSVMIWEKSQGYAEFDMQEKWENELNNL